MANLQTHVGIATAGGMLASLVLLQTGIANLDDIFLYLTLALVGSILPDLDSDHASIIDALFLLGSAVIAFIITIKFLFNSGILLSLGVFLLILLGLYLGAFRLVQQFTEHRGVIHSIPASLIACMATMILLNHVLDQPDEVAWLGGLFLWWGYLSHLILDELFKVNLSNQACQKPFGSGLKCFTRNKALVFVAMYLIIIGLCFVLPSYVKLHQALQEQLTWYSIKTHLLP